MDLRTIEASGKRVRSSGGRLDAAAGEREPRRAFLTLRLTLRWRWRWAAYECFAMRLAYARDRARMSVVFGHEADDHYGERHSALRDARRYIRGWLAGVLTKRLPDWFADTWFE